MYYDKMLYTINKNVICTTCGNQGAVQAAGSYDGKNFFGAIGPGGTIPHECLRCESRGTIDIDGLEGCKKAFTTLPNTQK